MRRLKKKALPAPSGKLTRAILTPALMILTVAFSTATTPATAAAAAAVEQDGGDTPQAGTKEKDPRRNADLRTEEKKGETRRTEKSDSIFYKTVSFG